MRCGIYTHVVSEEGRKYAEKVEAALPFVSGLLVEATREGAQEAEVRQL